MKNEFIVVGRCHAVAAASIDEAQFDSIEAWADRLHGEAGWVSSPRGLSRGLFDQTGVHPGLHVGSSS